MPLKPAGNSGGFWGALALPLSKLNNSHLRKVIVMKFYEYLKLRGGNNITNAEAQAIGIVIEKGWPIKYKDAEVPDHMAKAVSSNKDMAWVDRRKNLKNVANTGYIERNLTKHCLSGLKQCPFCGSGPSIGIEPIYGNFVACNSCGFRLNDGIVGCREKWQRREI